MTRHRLDPKGGGASGGCQRGATTTRWSRRRLPEGRGTLRVHNGMGGGGYGEHGVHQKRCGGGSCSGESGQDGGHGTFAGETTPPNETQQTGSIRKTTGPSLGLLMGAKSVVWVGSPVWVGLSIERGTVIFPRSSGAGREETGGSGR